MTQQELHTPVCYPTWQREYEAAIAEVDPLKVLDAISIAQAAIQGRLVSLSQEDRPAELDAIANALMFLGLMAQAGHHKKSAFDPAA
jgi:hypothetical protein